MYAKYSRHVDHQRQLVNGGGTCDEKDEGHTNDKKVTEETGTCQKQSESGSGEGTVLNCEQLWERLCNPPSECKSLLKKNLTQQIYDDLKDKRTGFNGRLEDCIRSGRCASCTYCE